MLDGLVSFLGNTGIALFDWRQLVMIVIACFLLYLALVK